MKCPTCKQPVTRDAATFPFCCERCRLADLNRWIDGDYVVPGRDGEAPPPDSNEH